MQSIYLRKLGVCAADVADRTDTILTLDRTGRERLGPRSAGDVSPKPIFCFNVDDLDVFPVNGRPSLEPPPSTLVLNEIEYPDIDRLLIEREQNNLSSPSPKPLDSVTAGMELVKPSMNVTQLLHSTEQVNNSAHHVISAAEDKRLRSLEKRITQLEREQLRRKQLDQLGIVVLSVYFIFKLLRSMF
ncbi:uncharacterized protein DEA37_0011250 [Paragonimus westermani]|uniref:Mitochondrial fission factor n=1 Tax=Paragonimus westermani TaxID=34504 RepID=A0A5J4NPY5_9TREM|nr:uncharacterized protein DEA37_0011250 [Paragonimus westermani]